MRNTVHVPHKCLLQKSELQHWLHDVILLTSRPTKLVASTESHVWNKQNSYILEINWTNISHLNQFQNDKNALAVCILDVSLLKVDAFNRNIIENGVVCNGYSTFFTFFTIKTPEYYLFLDRQRHFYIILHVLLIKQQHYLSSCNI